MRTARACTSGEYFDDAILVRAFHWLHSLKRWSLRKSRGDSVTGMRSEAAVFVTRLSETAKMEEEEASRPKETRVEIRRFI
jgi:hypothetical protein